MAQSSSRFDPSFAALDEEWTWLERHRRIWTARFDALDAVVEELQRKEQDDGCKP